MSTINIDVRPLAGTPELPGAQAARPIRSGPSRDPAARGAGADRPTGSHGAQPDSEPVTGKIYALKDGSGYVALASDGHYYKLEPGGGGFTYAAASGPVDTSLVNVTHGPVRTMRRAAVPPPTGTRSDDLHLPGSGDSDAADIDRHHASMRLSGTAADRPPGPRAVADSDAHAKSASGTPPFADVGPHAPRVPGPTGTEAAAAAARATHGLIVRHPGAALRSHAGVSPEAVASLLR